MKSIGVLLLGCSAGLAYAQWPDVSIKFNGYLIGRQDLHVWRAFKGYDVFGHYSTIGLLVTTEPGLKIFVTEKLRQIHHDGDRSTLDEAYVEGEGSWRIGKQYMPFGNGSFLRESVTSVRSDGDIGFLDIPFSVSGCDGGSGLQKGVVGRIGGNIGASLAIGDHFGINSTDFDLVRHPEEASGPNRGYRTVYGFDFTQKQNRLTLSGELVKTEAPETSLDPIDTLYDLSLQYDASKGRSFIIGFTHSAARGADYFRFQPKIKLSQNIFLEPMIRVRNSAFYDLSFGVHLKF